MVACPCLAGSSERGGQLGQGAQPEVYAADQPGGRRTSVGEGYEQWDKGLRASGTAGAFRARAITERHSHRTVTRAVIAVVLAAGEEGISTV